MKPMVAWLGALASGLASFALVHAWTGKVFDGRARSILPPLLLVGTAAAVSSGFLTHRVERRWWSGPLLVAVVWVAWWQVLLWRSLSEHG